MRGGGVPIFLPYTFYYICPTVPEKKNVHSVRDAIQYIAIKIIQFYILPAYISGPNMLAAGTVICNPMNKFK